MSWNICLGTTHFTDADLKLGLRNNTAFNSGHLTSS